MKGVPGLEAGFIVATYNGVPMIPTKDMPDEGAEQSFAYLLLGHGYLWFQTAIPTQYYESGIETGDPFAINRLGQEGFTERWANFGVRSLVQAGAFATYNEVMKYGNNDDSRGIRYYCGGTATTTVNFDIELQAGASNNEHDLATGGTGTYPGTLTPFEPRQS